MVYLPDRKNQQATYWAPGVPDEFGKFSFSVPVLANVRWEEKPEIITDEEGKELTASGVVYSQGRFETEGYLSLGDQTATADPRTINLAYRITRHRVIPDLFGIENEFKSWLTSN